MSRQELEALFLANLPLAERVLGALGRRHALSRDAAEEFGAWAKLRLIENDYAILAKFRGESSLATYLTVVISMLFREYRVQMWGRWRPSAAARRAGDLGVKLETLVFRDGVSLAEAGERLRTAGDTKMSDRELATIVAEFPRRAPTRTLRDVEPLETVEGRSHADERIEAEHTASESAASHRALDRALDELPEEDRLIVRLHYMEDMSVADIARALAVAQKPLYARLKKALSTLRSALERAGVSHEFVRDLAGDPR